MEYYAGIDVLLEQSSVCVVEALGKIYFEGKVLSEPEALAKFFGGLEVCVERMGLEAGRMSQWLHAGLIAAGREAVLIERRPVKAALSAMTVKRDRKDARGIAPLMRMGWCRGVRGKSPGSQEVCALLMARKLLQAKLGDVELCLGGLLRGFGVKVGEVSKGRFAARLRELVAGPAMLGRIAEPLLRAREALFTEFTHLHREMLAMVRADAVRRRLMTVPGVGALIAVTFETAVDDPTRFSASKGLGAHFGLTPSKHQSGETDVTGSITKVGDAMARTALYEAAHIMLTRAVRFSSLKRWAMEVAKRRGMKRAKVALARKLATILHRMGVDGATFRWSKEAIAAT